MNYSKIYINLIERSFNRSLDGYTEKHHIVPKCMGGDNKPRNIAILTPEEHFVAHQLLVKIYPNNNKLTYAMKIMCGGKNRKNKCYGWMRRRFSESASGQNNPNYGNKLSEEVRKKISKTKTGSTHSSETKLKMSISHKGDNCSQETRKKMSASRSGDKNHNYKRIFSKKTREKMSKAQRKTPVSQYSKDNVFIREYESMREAQRITSVYNANILSCCKGINKTAGGFIWKFTLNNNITLDTK